MNDSFQKLIEKGQQKDGWLSLWWMSHDCKDRKNKFMLKMY